MAISGKTTKLEWPYPLTTDKPPDGPANFKAQAERAEAIFAGTSGQVLIDQSTGVPAPKTLKGDATLAADGTLTLANGAIVEAKVGDAAVTSRKAKLTKGVVAATGNLALGEAFADIPGAKLEITPAVASRLFITAIFYIEVTGLTHAEGTINVDGADNAAHAIVYRQAEGTPIMCGSQVYEVSLTAAAHVIKMRANRPALSSANALGTHTRFMYELVAA